MYYHNLYIAYDNYTYKYLKMFAHIYDNLLKKKLLSNEKPT